MGEARVKSNREKEHDQKVGEEENEGSCCYPRRVVNIFIHS